MLPLSALSERFGRRRMMTVSLAVAVALALVMPFAPSLGWLIALRVAQGAALAGIPASAMAFLSEEVRSISLAGAVGLFIAGNSIGGMSGRILTGWVTEAGGWRAGLVAAAVSALLCTVAFRLLVPQSRHFSPSPLHPRTLAHAVRGHLANPLLVRLFMLGLLFMTVFGAVYTVIGYRLVSDEFGLSQGMAGSIFVIYLVGTFSSAAAGKLVGRVGRRGMLYVGIGTAATGLLLTLADSLAAVTAGLVLVTAGFFTGHAVASGAVSRTATDRPRTGGGPVPDVVLPGQLARRSGRRPGLPRGGLGRDGGHRPDGAGRRGGCHPVRQPARGPGPPHSGGRRPLTTGAGGAGHATGNIPVSTSRSNGSGRWMLPPYSTMPSVW